MSRSRCALCKRAFIGSCCVHLQQCGHKICFCCFHNRWVAEPFPACPVCKQEVKDSQIENIDNGNQLGDMVNHAKPDERLDLMRVWKKEKPVEESPLLIAAAYRNEKSTSLWKVEVNQDFCPIDEDSRKNLLKIFAKVLNPMLFDDGTSDKDKGLPLTPDMEVCKFFELPQQDRSLALPCLYALATAQRIWEEGKSIEKLATCDNQNIEAAVRGAFVAKDMLGHLGGKKRKVSRFQRFTAETLESIVGQGRTLLMETLSKFHVSASTAYLETLRKNRTLAALKKAESLSSCASKFYFCTISIDNFDLTVKGPKPSNDSWVLPLFYYDTREDLCNMGFYQEDPSKRINRLGELAGYELEIEHICKPTEYEWNLFSVSVLQCIDSVMRLKLPSLEEAKTMAKSIGDAKKKDVALELKWDSYDHIPRDYGLKLDAPKKPRVENGERTKFSFVTQREAEDAEEEEPDEDDMKEQIRRLKGLVAQNNMFVDFPVHQNLNKNDTVQGLMYNFKAHIERIQKGGDDFDLEDPSGEDPVKNLMIPISGDGAPASAEFKLKNWDELKEGNEEREFEGLQPFAGGFHWMKETLERRANSLLDVVDFFVRVYRETDNQAKQVMFPHDPRQAEEEMPFYLAAFYRAAADEYAAMNNRTSISPAEVHEHMVKRASEDPFALAVLQDLRFVQLFVLFQKAEKTRSADLFLTAIRLILPFLMTANAPNYISIATETLKWWALASDAEKILFENCIMTRKTAKGKPAFLDRVQEMMNTFFRFKVGHHWEPGTDVKMVDAAFGVGDIEKLTKDIDFFRNTGVRGLKTAYTSKETIRHNSIYVKLYVRIQNMNLWGTGPINYMNIESSTTCLQLPGSHEVMDSAILNAYNTGEDRAKAYVESFIVNGPTVSRPITGEDGVPIAFVGVSLAKSKKRNAALKVLRTGLDRKEINKAATFLGFQKGGPKVQLCKELRLILASWENVPDLIAKPINRILRIRLAKVEDMVDCLVTFRKEFFATKRGKSKRSEWEAELKKQGGDESKTSKEDRKKIVQSQIYSLSKTEIANYNSRIELGNGDCDDASRDSNDAGQCGGTM